MRKPILVLLAFLLLPRCTATTPAPSAQPPASTPAVARMWRGEVPLVRADEYEAYLNAEGLAKLRAIPHNLGVEMFRRTAGDREEFVVISYWPNEDAIRAYAGDDVLRVHLLPRDPEFLIEPDKYVRHYRIVVGR